MNRLGLSRFSVRTMCFNVLFKRLVTSLRNSYKVRDLVYMLQHILDIYYAQRITYRQIQPMTKTLSIQNFWVESQYMCSQSINFVSHSTCTIIPFDLCKTRDICSLCDESTASSAIIVKKILFLTSLIISSVITSPQHLINLFWLVLEMYVLFFPTSFKMVF